MFHHFQNFPPDDQYSDDFLIYDISDYDFWGQCDLFEAPQSIVEQPLVTLDHTTSTMSMILCKEDDIFAKDLSSPSQIMNSNTYVDRGQTSPSSMNYTEMDLKVGGMRRECSEPQLVSDHATETRLQKLSRYREKKMRRNFGKKI
ncbi:hypothetical protein M8C21_021615, partial [Ambrosia artemisiifolia]